MDSQQQSSEESHWTKTLADCFSFLFYSRSLRGYLPQCKMEAVMISDREKSLSMDSGSLGKSRVIVPTGAAHTNPDFWSTNSREHPLERLRAGRSIGYPDDP